MMTDADIRPPPAAPADLPPAILLTGPTASGKSALALEIAQRFGGEIVSVDSALVFRDMDIGTAKPDAAMRAAVPHHLLDLISPEARYSVANFCSDALTAMAAISARGNIPLLVGGTMLYVKALREGLAELPPADAAIRAQIDAAALAHGWPAQHARLAQLDPASAARLAPNDAQRIQRALEVVLASGRPLADFFAAQNATTQTPYRLPYRLLGLALTPLATDGRRVLHQRIAQRFDTMLKAGLVDELAALRQRYHLHPDLPAMRCVGYRQSWEFLEGRLSAAELRERGIVATRQLAKRQLTWLRSMPDLHAVDCMDGNALNQVVSACKKFLGDR